MTMKETAPHPAQYWQAPPQATPTGADAESLRETVMHHLVWCFGAFLAGSALVGISYWVAVLSRGSEAAGSVLSLLPGLVLALLVGAVVSVLVARRSPSRILPRLIFYSFAAPGLLAAIFVGGAAIRLLAQ